MGNVYLEQFEQNHPDRPKTKGELITYVQNHLLIKPNLLRELSRDKTRYELIPLHGVDKALLSYDVQGHFFKSKVGIGLAAVHRVHHYELWRGTLSNPRHRYPN